MKVPDFLPPLWHLSLHALSNPRSRLQDFESPFRLMRALSDLGAEGSLPAPPELVPMGARVLAQGYLNRVAMPLLRDWLLPRWMREQSEPGSPLFVPRSVSNLMLNQTARSWTALGLPGGDHPVESLVDRWGLLTPVPSGPSLDWWVEVDGVPGGPMAPSRQDGVAQRLQGGLPVVVTAYEANGLRAQSECWLLPMPHADWAAMQVVLFNISDLLLTGTFRFALRPYNPEGLSPIYEIEFEGRTFRADGRPGPFTWPRPDTYQLSDLPGGDLFSRCRLGASPSRVLDRKGFAHGTLDFRFSIEPWEEAEFLAFMPTHRLRIADCGARNDKKSPVSSLKSQISLPDLLGNPQSAICNPKGYGRAKAATMLGWRELLDRGMRVSLPDRDLQESWEANRCHLLALHDGDSITPGPDLYHSFWFRDAALMVHALSTHGYVEAAEELLVAFTRRQRRNGMFVSQMGEWDSTGQVIWAIGEHLTLHPNERLRDALRPAVERGARFLARTLAKWSGLMPPGISSEHLGPPDRYYWDNLWTLAGLRHAERLVGASWIGREARCLKVAIEAAWARDAQRCGGALPAAPGRMLDPGAVGTLAAWYPLGVEPADSPYLAATLRALEETLFHDGALFVHSGHSGWGTYLNMRVAGCYLATGSPKGWELMRWLLCHASPTYNWAEAIHPVSGMGSTGDGHHGWASAEWLLLVRSLLLREEHANLHIAPYLPEEWLTSAGHITVEAAPTSFGPCTYDLEWEEGGGKMRLEVNARWRTPPQQIVWGLPGPRMATIDGSPCRSDDGTLLLPPGVRVVEATGTGPSAVKV